MNNEEIAEELMETINNRIEELSDFIEEEIYVTMEHDYRWDGLDKKKAKNKEEVVVFKPKLNQNENR